MILGLKRSSQHLLGVLAGADGPLASWEASKAAGIDKWGVNIAEVMELVEAGLAEKVRVRGVVCLQVTGAGRALVRERGHELWTLEREKRERTIAAAAYETLRDRVDPAWHRYLETAIYGRLAVRLPGYPTRTPTRKRPPKQMADYLAGFISAAIDEARAANIPAGVER